MPIAKSEVPANFDEKLAVQMRFKVTMKSFDAMPDTCLNYWTNVSGIDQKFDIVTYQSSDHYNFKTQVPGMAKWSNVVLQRAVTDEDAKATMKWLKDFTNKYSAKGKGTMKIEAYTAWGDPGGHWAFTGVWPTEWAGPTLDTSASKPATEKLTLVHDGLVNSD
jgi:phage tail-like protein